jgi:ABC-type glycerol-3-phosphate transport system substrate-binding protein
MHRTSIRLRAVASLIAVLGLVACSSDKKSSDTTVVAAETQAGTAETTAAAETAASAETPAAAETQAAAAVTEAAALVTEAAAPASNEPQELTISYNKTGDWPEPEATLQAAKTGFEAANPGVKINLQSEVAADDAFRTKTQLRLQGLTGHHSDDRRLRGCRREGRLPAPH